MTKEYTKDGYVLRPFLPDEWPVFKAIRLDALKTELGVFGAPFDKENAYDDENWKNRLSSSDSRYFGLFREGECVGMTGVCTEKNNPKCAALIATYLKRPHRGKGLSALYYQARIEWAKENGFDRITVSHRKSNEASKAANQKFGFVYTHSEEKTWPDGVTEESIFYELPLQERG